MTENYKPPQHPMIHVSPASGWIIIAPNQGDEVILTPAEARILGLRLMEIALHELELEKKRNAG